MAPWLLGKCVRAAALGTILSASLYARDVEPQIEKQLQSAYNQMYDLNFSGARQTLEQYERANPDDAMGPLSEAATYMLQQFHRLGVLESDFFAQGGKIFGHRSRVSPDPALRRGFDAALGNTASVTGSVFRKSPNDANALLANVLALTLRGDYDALVEGHGWQALKEIKEATAKSRHLLALCPHCYDADLASGVENYVLGQQAGFARFFLRMGGAQTDERKGIQDLWTVAEQGRYFKTYAKVLLVIAAKRQHDEKRARDLMADLVSDYPDNTFFRAALKTLS